MTADGIVNASNSDWADTWKGAWTPLPSTSGSGAAASGTPLPPPGGLSGGAIAGIVIGVLLGIGLLAAGAAVLFLRRRRRRRGVVGGSADEILAGKSPYQDHEPKLASPLSDAERPEFKGELGGQGLYEMGGVEGEEGRRSELGDREGDGVGELEGTSTAGSPGLDLVEEKEEDGVREGVREGPVETGVSPRLDVDLEDTGGDFAEGLMSRTSSRRVSAL